MCPAATREDARVRRAYTQRAHDADEPEAGAAAGAGAVRGPAVQGGRRRAPEAEFRQHCGRRRRPAAGAAGGGTAAFGAAAGNAVQQVSRVRYIFNTAVVN